MLKHFVWALVGLECALALGEPRVITFPTIPNTHTPVYHVQQPNTLLAASTSDFLIASATKDRATPLLLDSKDDQAVHVAARSFAEDVFRVTGHRPSLYNDTLPKKVSSAIVVGTVDSHLIRSIQSKSAYLDGLKGKWESHDVRVIEDPFSGVDEALVVVGSDRRGAIFALYTMSEQMGVSPFYYWADVAVRHRDSVAFDRSKKLQHGEPSVKYRGLFINDEHPALFSWAQKKWDIGPNKPALLAEFYESWFEMMLRLKSNYFWPAMYASMFDIDGLDVSNGLPKEPIAGPNQVLANRMGIVMGSSHHEPMARNKPEWDRGQQGPWDWTNSEFLTDWWTYGAERAKGHETLFTLGMRGDGDKPLTGANNELVENITSVQQDILRKVYNTSDLRDIPQMWAMYKEVAEYFVNGLKVPEDVTVLFSDDNYGNIMSVLPPDKEHPAGAGIYYHFDYVGHPRCYKWINTISLAKTWQQMTTAYEFNTSTIWITNIGSFKPLELPSEHFLALAYDIEAWPRNSVNRFLQLWAAREFGVEQEAPEIAEIMEKYGIYSSRLKAELVNSTSWSLINFSEAERVQAEWDELVDRSEGVYGRLPDENKPAFYELVYVLCLMQANLHRLYTSVGRSNLYAQQYRSAANVYSLDAIDAFYQDFNLTESFHSMLDRKWDFMLTQTHINYQSHREPLKDTLPPLSWINPDVPGYQGIPIRPLQYSQTSYLRITTENSIGAWPGEGLWNCPEGDRCPPPTLLPMDPYGASSRWVDIGASGPLNVTFEATSDVSWLKIKPSSGLITHDALSDIRLRISVDWDAAPKEGEGVISISSSDGNTVIVTVPIIKPSSPPSSFHGFVQGDGYVVMEAAHFSEKTSSEGYAWEEIQGYGRTLSGFEMFPRTSKNFTIGTGPSLSYDFWTHQKGSANVTIQIGPTLNYLGLDKALSFGYQLDDEDAVGLQPIPLEPLGFVVDKPGGTASPIGAVPIDWTNVVSAEIRNVSLPLDLKEAGQHTLKVWGMSTGIVVERIWIDLGGILERGYSYLGPPESLRV